MSTTVCHFKWHVSIARVNSSITVSFYFSMYILNLLLNSWLFCWCSCREVNTVNLTEQDNPIFHQSNHVTYQLTQWPHSINTNIKEKHQYHTQYPINLEKWFITGLQLLIRPLTAVCSVSEQNLMFQPMSPLQPIKCKKLFKPLLPNKLLIISQTFPTSI